MYRRKAYSLLELLAVISIIGMLSALSASFLPDSLGNLGSKVDAHRLARDLKQVRSRAISTGDNHRLTYSVSNGQVIGYTIERVPAAGAVEEVDFFHAFADMVTVTTNGDYTEFDFEGAATGADLIILTAPKKTWQVYLTTLTGTVSVEEQ